MKKLLAVVLLLALPSLVSAQAFRVGSGVQLVPRLAAPTKITTNGVVWLSSSTSSLQYTNPAGTTTTIGASGGGVTWPLTNGTATNTYTSAVVDGATVVGHAFDSTNAFATAGGKLASFRSAAAEKAYVTFNGAFVSTLSSSAIAIGGVTEGFGWTGGAAYFYAGGASKWNYNATALSPQAVGGLTLGTATSYWGTVFSNNLTLISNAATPTAAGQIVWDGTNFKYTTNGTTWTNFGAGGGSTGNYTFSVNVVDLSTSGVMQIGSTNTTSVTLKSGAASGSGAVAAIVDTATAWGAGKLLSLRSNGAEVYNFGSTGNISVPLTGGIFAGSAGIALNLAGFAAAIVSGPIGPSSDLSFGSGTFDHRWTETWARRYAGIEQTIAAAATITIDPTNGETIRVALSATGITAVNGAAGYPGEVIRVAFIQDASGTRTYAGFSVAANGFKLAAVVPTTTGYAAAKRDVYTFAWDTVAALWIETGRTTNF